MERAPLVTRGTEQKSDVTRPFIYDYLIARMFSDNQTVTGTWALKGLHIHPESTSVFNVFPATPSLNTVQRPQETRRRLLLVTRPNPEVASLRLLCEELLANQAAQKEQIKQLQALVAHAQFPPARETAPLLTTGTVPSPAVPTVRNPWHQWIAAHRSELEPYRGRALVIDYEHGVVIDAEDDVELSDKLDAYLQRQPHPQEIRARLMLTHASYYLDEI
ncbi:hypothetical protein DB31_3814 [Hyalangium minutum]|uniref:Uncharacterized protein n=1 Tax=Hyalangium minutum TaxID=394096 RepID=A0A085W4T7_9BACT|nr:hypothetical protein DB31_3814 [Hyalangium minutum]